MTNKKDFNFKKAWWLFHSYEKKRERKKSKFIYELINFQNEFYPKNIIETDLLLRKYYSYETVKSVLSDLGYELTSYEMDNKFAFLGIPIITYTTVNFTYAKED